METGRGIWKLEDDRMWVKAFRSEWNLRNAMEI